jgi:tRNA/rRNA methyltransferase
MAAGAEEMLHNAAIFETLGDAIGDCQRVWATTAEPRDMIKPYMPPHTWAKEAQNDLTKAVVFGPERTGLSNEDIVLCHGVITIPVNAHFSSLNLAQALVVVAYEWFGATHDNTTTEGLNYGATAPATQAELHHFFNDLETTLDAVNYWRVPSKKAIMWRNLRNIFSRSALGSQEVRTLRGMLERVFHGKEDS